jgi:hypothetical protein
LTHAARRRETLTWPGFTDLVDFEYGYDAASRISSIAPNWNTSAGGLTTRSDVTETFTYDAAGQLTGVNSSLGFGPAYDSAFVYKPGGNRDAAYEPGGGTDGYTTGGQNRTSQDSTYSYQYDNEGDLTRRQKLADATDYETYAWDHRNRLTRA